MLVRNFEESEDELREAVADSMKNLFVMDDGSSDEAENTGDAGPAGPARPKHPDGQNLMPPDKQ